MLNAPTGSGKTFALWAPIALELKERQERGTYRPGLKAIWITPLRALSSEIQLAASSFAAGIGLDISIGIRNGDTQTAERGRQKKHMPDLLITTPESLHLLLASRNYRSHFSQLQYVVADEWHELLGSKRGVQTELALSRLRALRPGLQTWGISATIGNLEQAMEVLLGPGSDSLNQSELIRADLSRTTEVIPLLPDTMERFPWRGHLGLHLLDQVIPILNAHKTTLIFTNTRSQCELWFQALLQRYPEFAGEIAMHHGSMDRETRQWVEEAIRHESLRAVVCTSSLDLGVDFAPVEAVIQIGGPKGVARFMQRAGRSKHRPGESGRIYFLPTHALELVEASALKKAVSEQQIEDRIPYILSFDVLLQYLTTLAVSDGFQPEEIYREVITTYSYSTLSTEQWQWLINFLVQGSQSLRSYDEYHKLEVTDDGLLKVTNRGVAMRHRLGIGTIVSDAMMKVRFLRGSTLGMVEEWFLSKLQPGDVFTFAGRQLELYRIQQMEALVKKSKGKSSKVVSWMGGRLSFSSQMSSLLREELYRSQTATSPELQALKPVWEEQLRESVIPSANQFLIETFETREGHHALFYPFEGRFVHEAMSSLIAFRLSLLQPISLSLAFNDYGFELLSDQPIPIQELLDNELFSPSHLHSDLERSLNATEMARRKFRDIAVISGMVFQGYPGREVRNKHLQSSSQLLFDVFRDHEPDNLLYLQAYRETFEHSLEEGRLALALERIGQQEVIWKTCSRPTPLSFPIITDRLREELSSEKLEDRIRKMQLTREK